LGNHALPVVAALRFIKRFARVLLMLLALFTAAFIINFFRRQDRRTLTRSQFFFFNFDNDFVFFLRHTV
jgi:hypothetical protein